MESKRKRVMFLAGSVVSNLILLSFCFLIISLGMDEQKEASHRRNRRSSVTADIRNAYTAAQAYFIDFPNATVDLEKLVKVGGFRPSKGVALRVISGGQETLEMESAYFGSGSCGCYRKKVDAEGRLTTIDYYPAIFRSGD